MHKHKIPRGSISKKLWKVWGGVIPKRHAVSFVGFAIVNLFWNYHNIENAGNLHIEERKCIERDIAHCMQVWDIGIHSGNAWGTAPFQAELDKETVI